MEFYIPEGPRVQEGLREFTAGSPVAVGYETSVALIPLYGLVASLQPRAEPPCALEGNKTECRSKVFHMPSDADFWEC